jgi:hypothetical protein
MPSRSARNNNPGNMLASPWVQSLPGYVGKDAGGFAMFSDLAFGLGAMIRLLRGSSYRHLTIAQAIARWAPPHENKTDQYVFFVCKRADLDAGRVVESLTPQQLLAMVSAMVTMEGWQP